MEESAWRVILMAGPSFGKLGFEIFWSHFEASNDIFWGQNFLSFSLDHMMLFYTSIPFQQWCKNHVNQSSYAKFMPPTS
jgi:hypothetical protein